MTAPMMAGRPPSPEMVIIVATPAKDTPCTSGSWQPTRGGTDLHTTLSAELGAIAGEAIELAPVKAG